MVNYNLGHIHLGRHEGSSTFTKEVVVDQNNGWLWLFNKMDSVEIRGNGDGSGNGIIQFYGEIRSHVDDKNNNPSSFLYFHEGTDFDLWVGK